MRLFKRSSLENKININCAKLKCIPYLTKIIHNARAFIITKLIKKFRKTISNLAELYFLVKLLLLSEPYF